jgi:hypothetical protein
MKNRFLTIFFCSVMTFSLTSEASAAVTPGARCSKAGIIQITKGKTYTCIKSGKKLVWNKGVKFSGKLPKNFTPPASGKFHEQGSVIDGDRSFLGYSFTQEWQEIAANIEISMKSNGWECLMCQDFVLADETEDDHGIKYLMEMKNGTRTVDINISAYKGKTMAGFNFQPE